MQTADAYSMQATHPRMTGHTGMNIANRASTTAPLMRRAPVITGTFVRPIVADFTIPQRVARYGLTALAVASMSALFATQVAAMLH